MSARVKLARGLLRLGAYIQSLAVVVMRPDDLVAFTRQSYGSPANVEAWAADDVVDAGLTAEEMDLLADLPTRSGDLLVLCAGGGREAIPLARMGFHVTAVDNVPALVERAVQNATRRGVELAGLVQEISQLDVPAASYDVVVLFAGMYSSVPTRARRVEMVRRIARALRPGGWFLCQFQWRADPPAPGKGGWLRRTLAACSLGNTAWQAGDILWLNTEFIHEFYSQDAVKGELEQGGLSVLRIRTDSASIRGGAVCRKEAPLATSVRG